MPIFLEPGQRFPVVLDSDASKPAESRPTFYAKSQSMRGQQRIGEVLDSLTSPEGLTVEKMFSDVCDVLSDVLVGWEHMAGIEYSPDAIRDVLSYSEARELLRKVAHNQHVAPEEKKSSESPPL